MNKFTIGCALLATLVFGVVAVAQEKGMDMTKAKSALMGDLAGNLDDVESKLVSLAEATPQEKFTWRPAEGVRSVSEVFMHVVGGNYFVLSFAGVKPPPMDRDAEKKVTEKAKIIEMLKASFAHVRNAAMKASDEDLIKKTKMFGRETTNRVVYLTILSHAHEHMGQSIAYARMNGITPPWSRGEGN